MDVFYSFSVLTNWKFSERFQAFIDRTQFTVWLKSLVRALRLEKRLNLSTP